MFTVRMNQKFRIELSPNSGSNVGKINKSCINDPFSKPAVQVQVSHKDANANEKLITGSGSIGGK